MKRLASLIILCLMGFQKFSIVTFSWMPRVRWNYQRRWWGMELRPGLCNASFFILASWSKREQFSEWDRCVVAYSHPKDVYCKSTIDFSVTNISNSSGLSMVLSRLWCKQGCGRYRSLRACYSLPGIFKNKATGVW